MKHTVHVTVTYAVEVDAPNERVATATALLLPEEQLTEFERDAVVFEAYPDTKPTVRKGRGSY